MKLKQYIFVLVFSLALSGCASFKGVLPKAQPVNVSNKTVYIELELHRTLNGEPKYKDNAIIQQELVDKLGTTFQSAGYTLVSRDKADEFVYVKFNSDGKYNEIMSTITGLTLFIVPSTAHDFFTIHATVKTKKEEKMFVLKDSITTVLQLFMLPIMPFNTQSNAENQTIENMFKALVFDINNSDN